MNTMDRRSFLLAGTAATAWSAFGMPGFAADVPELSGTIDPKFSACGEAFLANFAEGQEVGASFAVIQDGKFVVDIWAGYADAARTKPWQRDTIVNVYSTTKTMTALCALVLADRGELSFDDPVAKYWPEFAAAGKADVRVSHFMAHTAGLPVWNEPVTESDLYDWEKATGLLAAQEPWWEPGTASGYHALTQGYLTGEVVRRVTGETLGTFFKKEIADPLGADFWIGTPASEDVRVSTLIPWPDAAPPRPLGPHAAKVFSNPSRKPNGGELSASIDWRRAEIPAANGHGNARGIALAQSVMAQGGEMNGKRILSEAGTKVALEEQISGDDLVLGIPLRHGMGYGLQLGPVPPANDKTIFWAGRGGSQVIVDMENQLTIAYAMNQMMPVGMAAQRRQKLVQAVYQSLA